MCLNVLLYHKTLRQLSLILLVCSTKYLMVQISLILPYFIHYFRKFLLLKKQHIITDEMALSVFSLEQSHFRPVNVLVALCGVLSRLYV